jgi:hypothetical protein
MYVIATLNLTASSLSQQTHHANPTTGASIASFITYLNLPRSSLSDSSECNLGISNCVNELGAFRGASKCLLPVSIMGIHQEKERNLHVVLVLVADHNSPVRCRGEPRDLHLEDVGLCGRAHGEALLVVVAGTALGGLAVPAPGYVAVGVIDLLDEFRVWIVEVNCVG